jgi:hypothetical protein
MNSDDFFRFKNILRLNNLNKASDIAFQENF